MARTDKLAKIKLIRSVNLVLVDLHTTSFRSVHMFFPFDCGSNRTSYQDYKRHKLKMLKAVRDFHEARLAATNAEILTIERQMSEAESSASL